MCLGVYAFHACYNKERRIYVQREWQKLNFVNGFFFYYCAKSFYKMIQTSARWRVHSSKRNYCFNSSPSFLMKFNIAGHMPVQTDYAVFEREKWQTIYCNKSKRVNCKVSDKSRENVHLNNRLLPFSGCCERASFHRLNKNYNENWQNPISMSNLQWHLMALKLCLRRCTVGCRKVFDWPMNFRDRNWQQFIVRVKLTDCEFIRMFGYLQYWQFKWHNCQVDLQQCQLTVFTECNHYLVARL